MDNRRTMEREEEVSEEEDRELGRARSVGDEGMRPYYKRANNNSRRFVERILGG